jgi:DNA-binding winged helix-turn-helix (wHTH) protein/Tfp pilus assembly protein PilF
MATSEHPVPAGILRSGGFELDLHAGELRRQGQVTRLQDKPLQLLVLLLERPGELVTREELQERLWGFSKYHDFEDSLNQAVRKLREALGDNAANPRFVETIPRRGYRFLAEIEGQKAAARPSPTSPTPITAGALPSAPAVRRWKPALAAACLAIILATAGVDLWRRFQGRSARRQAEASWREGKELLARRNLLSSREAIVKFRRAIELQPDFAPAYAGLAFASLNVHHLRTAAALEMADHAVRLDPQCGECQGVLGYLLYSRAWNWSQSGVHLERAVRLSPDDAQIRLWAAQREIAIGRLAEASRQIEEILSRHPQAFQVYILQSACQYLMRDYESAIRTADRALAADMQSAWQWRARALYQLGRHEEALTAEFRGFAPWTGLSDDSLSARLIALLDKYRNGGLEAALREWLDLTDGVEARQGHAPARAAWLMLLGRPEDALTELERMAQAKPFHAIFVGVDPAFDAIRATPRFRRVLETMGLASYLQESTAAPEPVAAPLASGLRR